MRSAFAAAPPLLGARARGAQPRGARRRTVRMARAFGVVITGSTKGVGRALARQFVGENDAVVVSSRTADGVRNTVRTLRAEHPGAAVFGCVADVSDELQVAELGRFARRHLPSVDAFICNAGTVGKRAALKDAQAHELRNVVHTNLLGSLLCAREAARIADAQQRRVHVFLMDGSGTIGNATATYAAYGATKRSVPQLVKSLNKECERGLCRFHCLSPGMVLTDLLLGENVEARSRRIFNLLAEEPRTVAEQLVPRLRAVLSRDQRNTYIKFLTARKAAFQLVTGFALGMRRNKFFDERTGERVDQRSGRYSSTGVRLSEES